MILHLSASGNWCLLAQREAWESLGNRFSGEHARLSASDLWSLGGLVLVGMVFVLLLRWLYNLQQARRLSCQPRHLFADLCRAHRLGRRDRKLLRALAEHHDVAAAAMLFVRPDLFDDENLPDDEKSADDYGRLKAKLFAGLEPDAAVGPDNTQPHGGGAEPIVAPVVNAMVDSPTVSSQR